MDELTILEHKVAQLILRKKALENENLALSQSLADAKHDNQLLKARMEEAKNRLDKLLDALPQDKLEE